MKFASDIYRQKIQNQNHISHDRGH